jgi:DNA-binding IscR family transcriptional regulator
MASAVQILSVIAYLGPGGTTAAVIARSLRTNPVVVRRLLKSVERAGLVTIRPGKDGGVQFSRKPEDITLDEIHRAVEDEAGVFALRRDGNPNCPVNRRMPDLLGPIFRATNEAVEATLRRTTLGSLVGAIR